MWVGGRPDNPKDLRARRECWSRRVQGAAGQGVAEVPGLGDCGHFHPIDLAFMPRVGLLLVEKATDGPRKGLNPPPALR